MQMDEDVAQVQVARPMGLPSRESNAMGKGCTALVLVHRINEIPQSRETECGCGEKFTASLWSAHTLGSHTCCPDAGTLRSLFATPDNQ